ncbi:hypothetical protein KSI01_30030 [Kurthia sibirica]|nr:hypothetical protein KSI01_30030 [Kurthia sibirica]
MQSMTIYSPRQARTKKRPVILYAHGGNWNAGDKTNVTEKPKLFTSLGYTFVSMNYRLAPQASYVQMAEDIALATTWLYEHAETEHFDMDDFHLMGHSAGGHLMTLIATKRQFFEEKGLSHSMIRSVTNIEGPLDITALMKRVKGHRDVFTEDRSLWREASPITYAHQHALPPLFIIAHKEELDAPYLTIAKAAGNKVKFFEAQTTSHRNLTKFIGSAKTPEAKDLTTAIIKFLANYSKYSNE